MRFRRLRHRLLFLAVAMTIAVVLSTSHSDKIRANEMASLHFASGADFLDSGIPSYAVEHFEKAVELEPDNALYHLQLAHAYSVWRALVLSNQGHCDMTPTELGEAATNAYRAAYALDPDDWDMAQQFGTYLFSLADSGHEPDWDEARAIWTRCHALREAAYIEKPSIRTKTLRIVPLMQLARVELRVGNLPAARLYVKKVLALSPDSFAAKRLAKKIAKAEAAKASR